ncbi:MAG TPA: hypothetical protein VMM79_21115 [Longimicrobiales bacterium]|nr:hypothetical protein [Longimicrobiales bacterium]
MSVLAALAVAVTVACEDDTLEPLPVTFVIEVVDEHFTVRATELDAIADLEQRRLSGQTGVITGDLVTGDGGFNSPWSWHIEPGTVEVADLAIELCDGRPSMVEADIDYWINTVGRFCPWSARVISRLN